MTEKDYLFYTYSGAWNSNVLPYTQNYPYSFVIHPQTKRLMHNGIIYGNGNTGELGPYFIKGSNLSDDTSGHWKGVETSIDQYIEGLSVIFLPNVEGNNIQTTLEINNLGARNCYYGDTLLTKQYSPGTPILLTYVGTSSSGYWKRADVDTLSTPVELNSTDTTFYINLTTVTNGLTTIYTVGDNLKYDLVLKTLSCNRFAGYFIGDVNGNANTATKLENARTLWGQQFDGSSNVDGDIKSTGQIFPSITNTYNIGGTLLRYNNIYANNLKGCADGLNTIDSFSHTIYLLGQKSNPGTDKLVYRDTRVFISYGHYLHAYYGVFGLVDEDADNSNYCLAIYTKPAYIDKNLYCNGNVGIGTTAPTHKLTVFGNALFTKTNEGKVTANEFIKAGGTSYDVLIADGSTKEWSTSETASTIVARNSGGDIYARRFYTTTSIETFTIASVFVSNGIDNAIRKVSFNAFIDAVSSQQPLIITKSLQVTALWMDTGITTDSTTFTDGSGTYIVQLDATSINDSTDGKPAIYSGIMTVYNNTTVAGEHEEIILHRAGEGTSKRLYLRTISTSSGACKLQISTSTDLTQSYNLIFKFKKML